VTNYTVFLFIDF